MKIHLPNSAFLGNLDAFIAGYDPTEQEKLEISSHKSWVSLHPVVLTMIGALGLTCTPDKITCEEITAKSGHYLERMGLFELLKIKSAFAISKHDSSGRFIPLTQIRTSDELSHFITEIVPLLHLEPKNAEPIKYILSELVRNVLEHAQTKNGAIVSAQYHKKSNMIRIGIADAGVGIRSTMAKSYGPADDLDALKLALTPGITGTTQRIGGTAQNAGAGLFFIKSIAVVNRNFFLIYSGTALYKLLKRNPLTQRIALHGDPGLDKHSERNDLPYWQGTVVGVDLSLDATSEFSSLLDLIRETYGKAVRDRKKARYRKPKFI